MGWLSVSLFVSFHLLLFHFPLHCSSMEALPLCNDDYASALLQFKSSFTLSSSASEGCVSLQSSTPKTTSWENGTNCCLWDGVTCDAVSGHVIGLDLSCSWLQGGFRPNSTIFQLPHLRTLNLAYNNFIASSVSSEIGNLVALTHLNLGRSRFAGEIPSRVSQLSQLLSLDLSAGVSSLTLAPSTWEKLILNATGLRELVLSGLDMSLIGPTSLSLVMNLSSSLLYLDLYNTRLQGNLAASGNILCLQNLQKLVLANNENLQGQFPKSNWSSPLRYLDLHTTAFSGEVPDSIGHLSSLEYLMLTNCQFKGPLPPAFGNLTQLTFLSLGMNKFSGEISCISNLQNLTYLDLSNNNFSGQIPSSLSKLQRLIFLDLSNNCFSGQIPSSLSNLQNLTFLSFSLNNPSGEIPYEFGKLSKLYTLSLCENNLGGQLPLSLFNLTQLSFLVLSSNKLIGPIPDKLPNLGHLDLSYNLINGTIPSWFYSSPSLYFLSLRDNLLTGSIGVFQTNSMMYFDLSNNKLQSLIPESIFGLVNLIRLSLSSNNFSGPVNFRRFSKLQNLLVLDLSNNKFLSINFDDNVDYTPQLKILD